MHDAEHFTGGVHMPATEFLLYIRQAMAITSAKDVFITKGR
jgi:hypothetical protein